MMTLVRRASPVLVLLLVLAVVAALATAPGTADAADHLDAPGLTSPGNDARLDINDLYVFDGANPKNTVLAMTVSPLATGDSTFANWSNGSYHFRVDTDGDGIEERAYSVVFLDKHYGEGQIAVVYRARGANARSEKALGRIVGIGSTDSVIHLRGGGRFFAGLRSDPFFFDLGGFLGTVEGIGDRNFNDGNESDFFAGLNTLGMVLEVRDQKLGHQIGVWATTTIRDGSSQTQNDRMGRPAINTVVNSSGPLVGAPSGAKNLFNAGMPRNDVSDFTGAVISALQIYSSLDAEGSYADAQAAGLAAALLPDVLTYDTSTTAAGPLNGRQLTDDVIDIELSLVTGGDILGIFDDRDAFGAINTDGVGPHDDYLAVFPYLGAPNG